MRFRDAAAILDGIPYTSPQKGRLFYDFIMDTRPEECLELGFAHGVSTCYLAAALHELGRGHLTSVDLEASLAFAPSAEELLERTGLRSYVTLVRETSGYNWFLKKKLEERLRDGACEPLYDFCFLDGSKNWTIDGFAFMLVDKLLRPGGWMVFDDYDWTYAEQEARTGRTVTAGVSHRSLSRDELEQSHTAAVFRDLVIPHPDYSNFRVVDDALAFAQKVRAETKSFRLESNASFRYKLVKELRSIRRRLRA